ncbi:MAG TPA: isoprenylcysteine carboxylmethyltransferase family protein, partial [Candidatus Acidoferrales bacterium]|nr:isoprenylcysteine carboxylmethyltransferase family protein [Candidatus Acidoferrales bacterium]
SAGAPRWAIGAGFVLIAADGYIVSRVERQLGGSRLVGHAELKGSGELATEGLYAQVRHPRYAGMMLSVLGACLLAGSLMLWVAAAVWWVLALVAVSLEERELRARFGAAYEAYSKRVPRFVPFRFRPRGQ